jgi:N6-L-threonylcarbamoyladenine synthase
MADNDYDFSFSGLKTAVKRLVDGVETYPVESICCEFENAVVDVLVHKTLRAVKEFDVKSVLLAGGVAANTQLRTRLKFDVESLGKKFFMPPLSLCGDNAVYIASAAFFAGKSADLSSVIANPSLGVMDKI